MKWDRHLIVVLTAAALVLPALAQKLPAMGHATPPPPTATPLAADEDGLSKTELRKFFEDTEWSASEGGKTRSFIFRKYGEIVDSNPGGGKYRFYTVEAPNVLRVYHGDPKKNRDADFMLFRVDLVSKMATQDPKASTIGGAMALKYVGPAKRAK